MKIEHIHLNAGVAAVATLWLMAPHTVHDAALPGAHGAHIALGVALLTAAVGFMLASNLRPLSRPLHALASSAALGIVVFALLGAPVQSIHENSHKIGMEASHLGTVGEVNFSDFDPSVYLTSWNYNHLASPEREKFYRESKQNDGTTLREYTIYAQDKNVEVAPGVFYAAWAYNGQVPGPTMRATAGDTIRITFINTGTRAHTAHFHGFHPAAMDGSDPVDFVQPGDTFTYEFKAEPAGTQLYHCHSTPLKKHIEKGLYGFFIVDPVGGLPPVDHEFIMMMNAFDTDFNGENDVYAVNTVPFAYMNEPIRVKVGERIRIHVANMVENDPTNSIHTHANFFHAYPTGTQGNATHYTDIIELGQGERARIEMEPFKFPGQYMFHAHQTEFTELGWMGAFQVEPNEDDSPQTTQANQVKP